jgi:hypothetical protein
MATIHARSRCSRPTEPGSFMCRKAIVSKTSGHVNRATQGLQNAVCSFFTFSNMLSPKRHRRKVGWAPAGRGVGQGMRGHFSLSGPPWPSVYRATAVPHTHKVSALHRPPSQVLQSLGRVMSPQPFVLRTVSWPLLVCGVIQVSNYSRTGLLAVLSTSAPPTNRGLEIFGGKKSIGE